MFAAHLEFIGRFLMIGQSPRVNCYFIARKCCGLLDLHRMEYAPAGQVRHKAFTINEDGTTEFLQDMDEGCSPGPCGPCACPDRSKFRKAKIFPFIPRWR